MIAYAKQKFDRWLASATRLQAQKNESSELAEVSDRDNLITAIDAVREDLRGRKSQWGIR